MERFEITGRTKFYKIASPVALAVDVLGLVLAGTVILTLVRPKFLSMFKDLGVTLPPVTRLLVSMPVVAWVLLFAIPILVLIAKEFLVSNKKITFAVNVAVAVVGILSERLPELFF